MTEYKASQVQRGIQRFRDYARDLISADMNTFEDRINVFVDYCTSDPIFSQLHTQLMSVRVQSPEDWYQERVSHMGGFAGSAKLTFPTETDPRIALQYRLVHAVHSGTVPFHDFLIRFFAIGSSSISLHIQAFCEAIVAPLCRELDYKLQEIEDNLPNDRASMVSGAILQIVHNSGTFIQQTSTGSGNTQTATIRSDNPEIIRLFAELREAITRHVSDPAASSSALEIVESAEEEVKKAPPRKTVVQTLLAALPAAGNIAQIASLIQQCLE